ncbi:MAG: general secretion pathway protein K [Lentisphaeria bacterium]|jgi:general secretion pathway protein K
MRSSEGFSANKHQRGVALIMAVMIVALVTAVAVEISWRFELSISRSANRWQGVQAKAYLEGAEHLAMIVLREDSENDETNVADHFGELWAQEPTPFPTDHGWVMGEIEDAQGRFNLNSMKPKAGYCDNGEKKKSEEPYCDPKQSSCDRFTPSQLQFIRLLQTVNIGENEEEALFLDTSEAEVITEAVIDWLDEDSTIRGFGGAESDHYEQLMPPLAIANNSMISVSELQVIKGMSPVLYEDLLPNIIALPDTKINIHTATISVLRTLVAKVPCSLEPLSIEDGTDIKAILEAEEFKNDADLASNPGLPAVWLDSKQGLAFNFAKSNAGIFQSNYFLFEGTVLVGDDHIRRSNSLIKRTANNGAVNIEVVRRTDANF